MKQQCIFECMIFVVLHCLSKVAAPPNTKVVNEPLCPEVECGKNPTFNLTATVAPYVSRLGHFCGNMYVLSHKEVPFKAALKACCSMGMELLRLETEEKYECARKLRTMLPLSVWTSATDEGSEGNWMWCSNKEMLTEDVEWNEEFPTDSEDHNCAILRLDYTFSVEDTSCDDRFYYVCQAAVQEVEDPDCETPMCLKCPKNETVGSIEDTEVEISIPANFSIWNIECGNIYIQSNYKTDYFTAFRTCCEIGLRLLSVETMDELQCLQGILEDTGGNNTWTSASNMLCKRNWQWCSNNMTFNKFEQEEFWDIDNQDPQFTNNVNNCGYLSVENGGYIMDENCDEPIYIMCEGPVDMSQFESCMMNATSEPQTTKKEDIKKVTITTSATSKTKEVPAPSTNKMTPATSKVSQTKAFASTTQFKLNTNAGVTTKKSARQKRATKSTIPVKSTAASTKSQKSTPSTAKTAPVATKATGAVTTKSNLITKLSGKVKKTTEATTTTTEATTTTTAFAQCSETLPATTTLATTTTTTTTSAKAKKTSAPSQSTAALTTKSTKTTKFELKVIVTTTTKSPITTKPAAAKANKKT